MKSPHEAPGANIAIKVPPHQFEETVRFYREVVGFEAAVAEQPGNVSFRFGVVTSWVDRCPDLSQSEVWLELQTDRLDAAARHLAAHDVARRDEIEPLPLDVKGFWIKPRQHHTPGQRITRSCGACVAI